MKRPSKKQPTFIHGLWIINGQHIRVVVGQTYEQQQQQQQQRRRRQQQQQQKKKKQEEEEQQQQEDWIVIDKSYSIHGLCTPFPKIWHCDLSKI